MRLETVYLKHVPTNQLVEAELHVELTDEIIVQWKELWCPAMQEICQGRLPGQKPEDSHWDWQHKIEISRKFLMYQSYSIMCGGKLQGLMITSDAWTARHKCHVSKPAVYIPFLATAPWNRVESVSVQYRGVGTVFLAVAIKQSISTGFRGRIALHALPEAEVFYRKQGLSELDRDPDHQNLMYFEMTEEGAKRFIA